MIGSEFKAIQTILAKSYALYFNDRLLGECQQNVDLSFCSKPKKN